MDSRRKFLQTLGGAGLGMAAFGLPGCSSSTQENSADANQDVADAMPSKEMFFEISLAEWSLHRTIRKGEMTNMDFPGMARNTFNIGAIEYVNQFFKDQARNQQYLGDLKTRCNDHDVTSLLIMVDGEGNLGDTDESTRSKAVDNHKKWLDAAKFLGCHSIRVNAAGTGTREEVAAAASDGLGSLAQFAAPMDLNVIVENHGGYSSDGKWLSEVISNVNMSNCGTLPDFGNFCMQWKEGGGCDDWYDRYLGVEELMPFAKGVSAKSHEFDENGLETGTDYSRMLQIVKQAGYTGYIGIEYEGSNADEVAGIKQTKKLLEDLGPTIS